MECLRCGASVPDTASFCDDCGSSVRKPCPTCGATNRHGAKFCSACGVSIVAQPSEVPEVRPARSGLTAKAAYEGAQFLEKCSLFRVLDQQTRYQLAARAHRYRFAPGELIFDCGSAGESMLAVLTGSVRITGGSATGREIVLADLNVGEVFGEIALLDGRGRSANATALSACELLVFERRDVLAFLETHPKACLKLLETCCSRLRHADERITEVAFSELSVRLAKVLLSRVGCATGTPKLALSQRELAMLIGGTRESVNRCLRDWRRSGIVHMRGGWIVIDTLTALEGIAAQG